MQSRGTVFISGRPLRQTFLNVRFATQQLPLGFGWRPSLLTKVAINFGQRFNGGLQAYCRPILPRGSRSASAE